MWNNDDGDYSMQGWLCKIRNAKCVLTDSFHCMVMCLKLHKPFVVVTDVEGNEGMNDRFYSLLSRLGLSERVVYKNDMSPALNSLPSIAISWTSVDATLISYATKGINFLKEQMCELADFD